jgi:tRNA(Ile2) C34 agmatinyltransferase TiaS
MRIYVCFDDTDTVDADRGTGKLARWFEEELPDGCTMWGVIRQQLLVDPAIPYTSHNSSACVIVETPDASVTGELIERGIAHIERHSLDGADPGLCVAAEDSPAMASLARFGRRAAVEVVTKADAMNAAQGVHLSGHGGTEDGIIGAAAGVGLTHWGWSGRFVEYGAGRPLRGWGDEAVISEIESDGMLVLPVDRNVVSPRPSDTLETQGWLRPRLWGGIPAVPVAFVASGVWTALGKVRAEDETGAGEE